MNKKLISLILSMVILFTLFIPTTLANTTPPPFGTINGDTWTVFHDNSHTIIPVPDFYYSITPVPVWNEVSWYELINVPSLTIEQGSIFTFTEVNVVIYAITEWDYSMLAEHTIAMPPVFEGENEGEHIFADLGLYMVVFINPNTGDALSGFDVEVVAPAAAPTSEISVVLNGEILEFDVPPQIIDNRTMVPMRAIFETLGMSVHWMEADRQIVALGAVYGIQMRIGDYEMTRTSFATLVGDEDPPIILDVPPMIVDNRTLVPLRAISEALGATVDWDSATQTVIIEVSL
ncbi:MAG: copper amine oxidase N-terminal domain-containing protein [Oscillospiraceae bacterium]|nr:copper amine oxidase N-terminal domain-containing protein [Oscillospiraceae bacterium]